MSDQATKKIIEEIESLPVDERVRIADSILKTLNPVNQEIEDQWIEVAESRLRDLKTGKIKPVSGNEVFEKIQKRFSE